MNLKVMGQVAIWMGIVSQLYTSRLGQLLSRHSFTTAQFSLLNHLARHHHEQHTISALAAALEVNQPGVTKIVKKLSEMGLIASERDAVDSRKKYVSITQEGFAAIQQVQQDLSPDMQALFANFEQADLETLLGYLKTIGAWLDSNRL